MNTTYLLLNETGKDMCSVRICDDSVRWVGRGARWPLLDGKQLLYVNGGMIRDFKPYHLFGTYQKGAQHAISFDDAHRILTHRLGRSEEDMAQSHDPIVVQETTATEPSLPWYKRIDWVAVTYFLYRLMLICAQLIFGLFKVVMAIVVALVFSSWFKRHR